MSTKRAARRGYLSGVALIALIAGAGLAFGLLRQRLAPVELPGAAATLAQVRRAPQAPVRLEAAPPVRVIEPVAPARRVDAATRPDATLASDESRWVRVLIAPERRYERTLPPVYGTVEERILLEPERDVVETVPAKYGTRTRRVLLEPARTVVEIVPAKWEWRDRVSGLARRAAWETGGG